MAAPAITMVPVDQLIPTPDNPRVFRRDAAQKELVESVRKLGILQPLVARPMGAMDVVAAFGRSARYRPKSPGTNYDLRCGHRRLEAAKEAGLKVVPVIVREMDNKTAMEITVTENLQREDLSPLEEARGVQRLLDVGWEISAIADRLGKPASWVARRAKLLDLDERWLTATEADGHWASAWSGSLLEVIARLPEATQAAVLDDLEDHNGQVNYDGSPIPTVKALEKFIANEHLHVLSGAPWKLDDDTLVPEAGACNACQKRSGCQPLLFDEVESDSKRKTGRDQCLDAECYSKKLDALVERRIVELTVNGVSPKKLIGEGRTDWEKSDQLFRHGAVRFYSHMRAKKTDKGAVRGVIVLGKNAGEAVWLKGHEVRGAGSSSPGRRVKGQKATQKEKEAQLEKRRRVWAINRVCEHLQEMLDGKIRNNQQTIDELAAERAESHEALRMICAFGTAWKADSVHADNPTWGPKRPEKYAGWKALEGLANASLIEMHASLWRHVLRNWTSRLHNPIDVPAIYKDAECICAVLKWEFSGFRTLAEEAIRTPKSWAQAPAAKRPTKTSKSKKPKAKKKLTAREAVHERVKGMKTPGRGRKAKNDA